MSRTVRISVTLAALLAAGGGGYWSGRNDVAPPAFLSELLVTPDVRRAETQVPQPAPTGPVIYYRDPDGRPFYALKPEQTADGRAYLPVQASEDVSFEERPVQVADEASLSEKSERRILYYRNPMGLPDTSPTPKKDWMGMDYIPVYEGEEKDGGTILISPGRLQRTGVRTARAERRVLSRPVRAPGTIQLDERRVTAVAVRSEAFIEKVEDITTGDRVRKGQPLFKLYSPDIAAAAAQYLSFGSPASPGSGLPDGARRRLENLAVPPEVMAEIERTRKVPLSIIWPAPRDGIILERNVIDGMRAMPGETLFRLADLSTVWAVITVAERDLPLVAVGQSVNVRPRGYVDRTFNGNISLIHPQLDPETRSARVRVELADPDNVLRLGMYVDAEIATGHDAPVVAVPESAVIDSGVRQIVILDRGEGRFEPREIRIGRRGEDYVEISGGVAEGDRIVVAANFLIDAESNLKAALQSLADGERSR